MRKRVVIVGGGQSGGRLAHLLSQEPAQLDVTLVCDESHPPYERPPLSKTVITGATTLPSHMVWKSGSAAWHSITMIKGDAAVDLDRDNRVVTLESGANLEYDKLVIATGSSNRPFNVRGSQLRGVVSLRTYEDALVIARRLKDCKRLLVVGGGFIGLEVAAAARELGIAVRVIEASDSLLSRIVPRDVARQLLEMHEAAGVKVDFMTMVETFTSKSRKTLNAAVLSNGETVECDVALIGVGVAPNVALARRAKLEIEVGICTDERLVTSDDDILACGDVAAFWHPLFGRRIRVEAWQNAEDHAVIAAATLRRMPAVMPSVPFFWSDQYRYSLQLIGLPHLGLTTETRHTPKGGTILVHTDLSAKVVGATGFGTPDDIGREMRRIKSVISKSQSLVK
jgi:3-phenylpropionate/trans-cinnamate dioxygenase ferredoxin reductase subunit